MLMEAIVAAARPDQSRPGLGYCVANVPVSPRVSDNQLPLRLYKRSGVSAMVPRIFKRIIVKRKNFTQQKKFNILNFRIIVQNVKHF